MQKNIFNHFMKFSSISHVWFSRNQQRNCFYFSELPDLVAEVKSALVSSRNSSRSPFRPIQVDAAQGKNSTSRTPTQGQPSSPVQAFPKPLPQNENSSQDRLSTAAELEVLSYHLYLVIGTFIRCHYLLKATPQLVTEFMKPLVPCFVADNQVQQYVVMFNTALHQMCIVHSLPHLI